jgi:DNA-binding NarL/FixJ family response regulator
MPRALTARVISEFRRRPKERRLPNADGSPVTLSERESEVLELLRGQLTTEQIAQRLGVSPVTVRRHISAVLKKLRVRDRAAALRLTGDYSQ